MGFQSPDYALVLIIALSSIAAFSEPADSLKAIVMALFGLMLGTIGTDQSAGIQRFTFGLTVSHRRNTFYTTSNGYVRIG
ncbi:MAG: hypothetical protein CM1200mP24_04870 [Gammaproteobacteria bacterium]|nr:MAG: hypothetical protein CM1200mP24_04870 [Gammaproteobacteria bacterium]